MIFKQVVEILAGLKTETRRPHDEWHIPVGHSGLGDESDVTEVCQWALDGKYRSKWVVGRTYAIVPGRGKPAIKEARIRITGLRLERLWEITESGARAEGVIDRAEYQRLWTIIYKEDYPSSWKNNPLVWVITFELVTK